MNALTPLAIRIGALAWLPRFLRQITAVDRFLQRVSRGRWSLLRIAGLPSLMLTVVGRKSGVARSTPLLCVPYQDGVLIAGSNFGGAKPPVWVVNVRAASRVRMRYDGAERDAVPHELEGVEREQAWQHMLATWPNYARYAERTGRTIPVFYLDPAA
ncbi:nitroreductase family deazaflavin-dependent oxidoreductase [Nocardioides terrisoli]|uniref:nitroreductase family deazaflavin-dependent oxidoreductase n=1 Tax=Nocardioides terrisoli TaxID=3388267 RepID=UPI00287B682B|nr:nitroreductase family deazaflavin-dependent oxidoreductase [Nocardioides marmorisolisilvae]